MHAASVVRFLVQSFLPGALVGKNGDPQISWMKEEVLEQRGCSFQVDKFQQLSTNQGLICIVSDVGVPKLVPAFRIIKSPHLRGES